MSFLLLSARAGWLVPLTCVDGQDEVSASEASQGTLQVGLLTFVLFLQDDLGVRAGHRAASFFVRSPEEPMAKLAT